MDLFWMGAGWPGFSHGSFLGASLGSCGFKVVVVLLIAGERCGGGLYHTK